ncbi:MAG: isopeptide-forming domain-containing fimbrial protein [[Eubacterium] rectale]|nr:isopeptide-forming domain-containing fimbrial protein [Agathobacter rectalis]MBD9038493.1 isopeptide-forming domain-containing fimbrial protein [Agathobacter rectalis]
MKTIKRSIAFVLAMILTLAMSVTVFAEGEGAKKTFTITVNEAKAGHTYEAYQILKGDLSKSQTTLSNVDWGTGIKADKKTDLANDAKAYVEKLSGMNSSDIKAEAQKIASVLSTTVAGSVSVTQDNAKAEITGLEPGYYLIKDKDSSLKGDEAYTEYILNIVADTTITPKTDVPSVEKKVKDTNDTTGDTTEWQDSADYDIGDVVPFQLTAKLPANVESYKSYYLKFDDTLSQGLDFNEGTVTVKLGNKDVTEFFKTNYDADNKKLTFTCDNILAKGFEAKNGDTIVVEYKATLNENAVIGSEGNPNKVKLEFSNNPNNGGEGDKGETPDDTVIVFTYKVVINKVDENNKALDGAEFTLYKKIKGAAEDKEIKAVISGDKNDVFTFSGLDDGDYVLKETKTPDSYNTAKDIAFTITADHSIVSDAPELKSLSGDKVTGNITLKADKAEGSLSTPVQNFKGSVLPSTGGAGRVAIYVIGAILVVGGGIVLVTKKRVK